MKMCASNKACSGEERVCYPIPSFLNFVNPRCVGRHVKRQQIVDSL